MSGCRLESRVQAAGDHFLGLCLLAVTAAAVSLASGCASVANPSSASSALSVVPAAVDFKAVVIGEKNSQALTITNISASPIGLRSLRVTHSNFALRSARVPTVLEPGAKFTTSVAFAPSSAATVRGELVLYSPDFREPLNIPLSGSGEKADPALQVSPASVNFGTRPTASSNFQTVSLKNGGNVSLRLESARVSSAAFSISGFSAGVSLAPGQQVSFQVWFRPSSTGAWSGTISVAASSLSAPVKLAISGGASSTAATAPSSVAAHLVTLDWDASTSSVAGYHVYRGESSGGPYNRITGSLLTAINYSDSSVASGSHYFYVVTAVESDGAESAFSNEVSADIPN